jgi:TetR/AcrR family transcriptional repressor of nem operon
VKDWDVHKRQFLRRSSSPKTCSKTGSPRYTLLEFVKRTKPSRRFKQIAKPTTRISKSNLALTFVRVRAYSYVMRYSLEHKAQNHENILSVAARSFREHGGDSSGIGTVMKKVGLTKGGFYRHFKSKDDLFVEAVARAFDEMGRGMVEVARSAPEGQALRAIIERYLSVRHANSPGMGCVFAALGPELTRKPLSVRKRIEASREAYRERLLPFVPGQTREKKLAKFQLLFPSMAGVLTAVRMTLSPQRREQMLMEARNFFIKCFAEG